MSWLDGAPQRAEAQGLPVLGAGVSDVETVERELFVRHAKRDGNSVAILRAIDRGGSCVVEADVFPAGTKMAVKSGPYTFEDAGQATVFVNEAVESLLYLGCDVYAQ